jgi:hypothetical protein
MAAERAREIEEMARAGNLAGGENVLHTLECELDRLKLDLVRLKSKIAA